MQAAFHGALIDRLVRERKQRGRIFRPSALAVLRLMANSSLID
jgi:hypothetical protein